MTTADVPEPVLEALSIWLDVHDRLAPGLIEGLYVVGSVALRDWHPGSDVDIVAVTADPATPEDADVLEAAHDAARAELADDTTVDGPIVAWGDLSVPPMPMMRPWSLDGEYHFDGDCFEIHPVTWLTLARYGIAARGPVVRDLGVATDPDEVHSFVRQNVGGYWRGVASQVEAALYRELDRAEFPAEMTTWCCLGAARMLFTFETGDVASKTAAGEWCLGRLPEHEPVLRRAIEIRTSGASDGVDDRTTVQATHALLDQVVRLVAG